MYLDVPLLIETFCLTLVVLLSVHYGYFNFVLKDLGIKEVSNSTAWIISVALSIAFGVFWYWSKT
jgi:hypothetical protein